MIERADRLRQKAKEYELDALACDERNDHVGAAGFRAVALALNEAATIEVDLSMEGLEAA